MSGGHSDDVYIAPALDPGASGPSRRWSRWWVPAVCAVASLPLIFVLGPEYLKLQQAPDAASFRDTLGDDRWRYAVAAAIDVVFAASYGLAAFAISRRTGLARWAPVVFVLGALLDEVENVFVLVKVLAIDRIGETTVDIMGDVGKVKIWTLLLGIFVLIVAALWLRWRRRKDPIAVPDRSPRATPARRRKSWRTR